MKRQVSRRIITQPLRTDSLPLGFVKEFETTYGRQAEVAVIDELEKAVRAFFVQVESSAEA